MLLFEKITFEPGKVIYDDLQIDENNSLENQTDNLKEDLFQVNYDDEFIVDVGWYPSFSKDGQFRVVVIEDFNWDSPILQRTCRTISELREYVEELVSVIKLKL